MQRRERAANIERCTLLWWAEEETKLCFQLAETLQVVPSEAGLILPVLDLKGSPAKLLK